MSSEPDPNNSPNPDPEPSLVNMPEPTPASEEGDKSLINDPPKAEPEPAAVEPIAFEALTLPEGFELDETLSTEFIGLINNNEMSPVDRANALIALHTKTIEAALAKDQAVADDMQANWQNEVKADPDVGGTKLQPVLTDIGKLIDEYGTDELRGVLDLTGAGNNVHLIKFLSKIAGKLVEPSLIPGSPGESRGQSTAAQRMYPSMKG